MSTNDPSAKTFNPHERIPGTYAIPLSNFEPFKPHNPINIHINLNLGDVYELINDFYLQDNIKHYYKNDEVSVKLREILHGWLTDSVRANPTLSKVPATPPTSDSAFTYSGPEHLPYPEFQVW